MKKYLPLLFLLLSFFAARAQRTYLGSDGLQLDKAKGAVSYFVLKKMTDSAWQYQLFDMQDTLEFAGTFKDQKMTVPDGKFVYYYPFKHFKGKQAPAGSDTIHHIQKTGRFKNGLRDGEWIFYDMLGYRLKIQHYEKNQLNGPYKEYDPLLHIEKKDGQYEDGVVVGDWYTLNHHGEIIQADNYVVNDNHYKSKKFASKYTVAQPRADFYPFIEGVTRKLIHNMDKGQIVIICKVSIEGRLSGAMLGGKSYDERIEKKLLAQVSSSPAWLPAINTETQKHADDVVKFTIDFDKSEAQANYIAGYEEVQP
jgi:hypothetical protein